METQNSAVWFKDAIDSLTALENSNNSFLVVSPAYSSFTPRASRRQIVLSQLQMSWWLVSGRSNDQVEPGSGDGISHAPSKQGVTTCCRKVPSVNSAHRRRTELTASTRDPREVLGQSVETMCCFRDLGSTAFEDLFKYWRELLIL